MKSSPETLPFDSMTFYIIFNFSFYVETEELSHFNNKKTINQNAMFLLKFALKIQMTYQ